MSRSSANTAGLAFEARCEQMLESAGYGVCSQAFVGHRPGNFGKHKIDIIAYKDATATLVSCKYQNVQGTAQEKMLYEIVSLDKILRESPDEYDNAIIVLGGEHWQEKHFNYYCGGEFRTDLPNISDAVRIVSEEMFAAMLTDGNIFPTSSPMATSFRKLAGKAKRALSA